MADVSFFLKEPVTFRERYDFVLGADGPAFLRLTAVVILLVLICVILICSHCLLILFEKAQLQIYYLSFVIQTSDYRSVRLDFTLSPIRLSESGLLIDAVL